MSRQTGQSRGVVSVWVGSFPSMEAAEGYFGIPEDLGDDIGVYLPPEGFAADLEIDDFPAEGLEVDFEQLTPRPLRELLRRASLSASFLDQAVEAAARLGITEAQGVALIYHFDYEQQPGQKREAGPMTFVGSFRFDPGAAEEPTEPVRDPRIEIRGPMDTVL